VVRTCTIKQNQTSGRGRRRLRLLFTHRAERGAADLQRTCILAGVRLYTVSQKKRHPFLYLL